MLVTCRRFSLISYSYWRLYTEVKTCRQKYLFHTGTFKIGLGDLKIACPSANELFVSCTVSKGVGRLWGRCSGCGHLWGSLKNGFFILFSLLSKSFLHFSWNVMSKCNNTKYNLIVLYNVRSLIYCNSNKGSTRIRIFRSFVQGLWKVLYEVKKWRTQNIQFPSSSHKPNDQYNALLPTINTQRKSYRR
jgi:hypothetical protein